MKYAVTFGLLCSCVRWVNLALPLRAMSSSVVVGSGVNTVSCVLMSCLVAPLGTIWVTRKWASSLILARRLYFTLTMSLVL